MRILRVSALTRENQTNIRFDWEKIFLLTIEYNGSPAPYSYTSLPLHVVYYGFHDYGKYCELGFITQGPVVQKPINANPRLEEVNFEKQK